MDEGMVLVYPERILEGDFPIRDFESLYGPGNYLVLAGVYATLGTDIDTERAIGFLYRLLIIAGVFAAASRWGALAGAGCALISAIMLSLVHPTAFSWTGAIAAAIWGVTFLDSAASRNSRWKAFAGGLLLGVAVLYRWDLGIAVVLSAAVILWRQRGQIVPALSGFVIANLPYVWLAALVGPIPLIERLLLDPINHIDEGRRLPFASLGTEQRSLAVILVASVAILIVSGLIKMIRDRDQRFVLALGLLSLGLLPQALHRADTVHLLFVACIPLALVPLAALVHRQGAIVAIPAVLMTVAILFLVAPDEVAAPAFTTADRALGQAPPEPSFEARRGGRHFPLPSFELAGEVQAVLRELDANSEPGDRLFVGPMDLRRTNYNDTFIYHLTPELEPATYFLEMNPGTANREGSRLAEDLSTADIIVLTAHYDSWDEPNASRFPGSTEPLGILRSRFCQVAQHGGYSVWVVCPELS